MSSSFKPIVYYRIIFHIGLPKKDRIKINTQDVLLSFNLRVGSHRALTWNFHFKATSEISIHKTMLPSLIFTAGVFMLLSTAYKVVRVVYIYFVCSSSLPRYLHGNDSNGSWALVTGSTDGIGFGLAQELCSRGFNVIIHGRSPTKLDAKARELRAAFPSRSVKTWEANALSASPPDGSTPAALGTLEKLLKQEKLNLTVLINNIGGADAAIEGAYKNLVTSTMDEINGMVQFNAGFALHVTRTVLPVLLANKPSLIMNIGSHADAGSPYLVTYSASKAFNMAFSVSLRAEMQGEGLGKDVEVIGIVSGQTVSATTKKDVSFSIPSARQFAKCALDRVGCGKSVISAYWVHGMQRGFLNAVPESLARGLLVKTVKGLMEARRSGLSKGKEE